MSSRLKRKLNDLGVDTQSAKVNENFCLIGTPLPPLEKAKDKNEFVPLWKQEVRDEKGRRRLHGAFTGGFSAGYFNTVGSKEGWAPSTFVSSRAERAKQRAARPEDFMDEEDLAEIRESRQLVDVTEEMEFAGTEAELRKRQGLEVTEEADSMTAALASALAPPPTESAGARILMKMGWRPGHGIGPRLTYEQRRAQDRGFDLIPSAPPKEEEVDEEAKKHMYPRRDTPVLTVTRKDNAHGLGYTPGMSLNESLGKGKTPSGPRISAGFGLGALNEAEEDDLDIYDGTRGPRGHARVAYDVFEDEERISMGSSKRSDRIKTDLRASLSDTQTFMDGTQVLKDFVLYPEAVVLQNDLYPFPEIPQGWKPNPRRVWDADKDKENIDIIKQGISPEPKTHKEWKESLLSADQRGSLLGEIPLPSKPRSVFEYLSQKDRERLQSVRSNLAAGAPPDMKPAVAPQVEQPQLTHLPGEVIIPHIHPSVAKAALQGFQPFLNDAIKQSRYTAFLNYSSQAGGDLALPASIGIGPLPTQSVEDFNKELSDYAKSATVFKPLSGAMAGRFTSSKVVEMGPKIVEGLHTPDLSSMVEDDEEKKEEKKEEEDPRRGAVRLGMYGPMTREVQPWQPAKLLCKRFGVKEPEIETTDGLGGPIEDSEQASSSKSDATLAPIKTITAGLEGKFEGATESTSTSLGSKNLANVGMGEDETQGADTLTYVRPPMDVFKAIFASDDEESDEEDKENKGKEGDADLESLMPLAEAEPILSKDVAEVKPTSTPTPMLPEKVDMATFKPTFVPKVDRDARARKEKSAEKEKRKDKEKRKVKPSLVSFDDDEGGLQFNISAPKRKKHRDEKDGERKKKKRKEKDKDAEEDEGMWEEAPPPEVVQKLEVQGMTAAAPVVDEQPVSGEKPAGPHRGRARAVDFM